MSLPSSTTLFEALHTRRSIRKYDSAPIPQDHVRAMLGAAMTAPSAGNAKPWRFVVVTDRAKLDEVGEKHPHASFSKQAPLAILVCGDLSREKYPGYWPQDCSAAVQNLLLAAYGLGYGSCWCGVYPNMGVQPVIAQLFNVPPHVIPMAWVVIGKPGMEAKAKDRYDETLVHENGF